MGEWRFETIPPINVPKTLSDGTKIPAEWQMWEQAYFKQVVATLADTSYTAKLIDGGCNNTSSDELNCLETCNSTKLMFQSPENLWNCLTLSTVSMMVTTKPQIDTVDQKSERAMDAIFHFGNLQEIDDLRALGDLRACLWQSCSDSKYGTCTPSLFGFKCDQIHQFSIQNFSKVLSESYCKDADPGVDLDLVGQGVSSPPPRELLMADALTR